jgi:hypothetical protein
MKRYKVKNKIKQLKAKHVFDIVFIVFVIIFIASEISLINFALKQTKYDKSNGARIENIDNMAYVRYYDMTAMLVDSNGTYLGYYDGIENDHHFVYSYMYVYDDTVNYNVKVFTIKDTETNMYYIGLQDGYESTSYITDSGETVEAKGVNLLYSVEELENS